MSVTQKAIEAALKDEDDFGHEMRVGGILKNVKAPPASYAFERTTVSHPSHGGTYQDPVTAKPRQFDYRCKILNPAQARTSIMSLPVECKNINPDFPLVVCGRARDAEESWHVYLSRNQGKSPVVHKISGTGSIYEPGAFVGKSLLRPKMSAQKNKSNAVNESEIYDRWSQALASSRDLVASSLNSVTHQETWTFVMPLVVLPDNSLWSAHYNYDGKVINGPSNVDECQFYVDHLIKFEMPFGTSLQPALAFPISHIHFVTMAGLSRILTEFADANAPRWESIFRYYQASVYKPSEL